MAEFEFLKNNSNGKWVILAPRRSKRTNVGDQGVAVCPFCPEKEADWKVNVIPNKFPFAPQQTLIIHSPDHHKNFDELPLEQVELIFQTYKTFYNTHKNDGQVYIFHNRGHAAGESLPHPHTQLTVVPSEVRLEIAPLSLDIYGQKSGGFALFRNQPRKDSDEVLETEHFMLFCPPTSEWPDEVWVAPKRKNTLFGDITEAEIKDFAFALQRLIQIFDLRHGAEFPFNFYIYPFKNWYLRIIPRLKILGGFELGTNVSVNTQDPKETFAFLKEHFWEPKHEMIKTEHQADYVKSV